MAVDPYDVVKVARSLIDTPYQHQGRLPGVGLDCIGLPIVICRQLGLSDFDITGYSRDPDGSMIPGIEAQCRELPDLTEGALGVFAITKTPHHVGIISLKREGYGVIHAYQNVGRVKEHELIKWWRDKLVGVYALPNVHY